jgi:hypothetical protein
MGSQTKQNCRVSIKEKWVLKPSKMSGIYKRKMGSQTKQNCRVSIKEKWVLNHPKERERKEKRAQCKLNPKRQRRTRRRRKKELTGKREKNIKKTKGGRKGRKEVSE